MDPAHRFAANRHEFGEYGGVNASVEVSTTFTVLKASTLPEIFAGHVGPEKGGCYVYGRSFNPTVRNFGRQLAALEGMEAGYGCSSGMAAISAALMALCNSGDHIVSSNTVYGGTHALLKTFLPAKSNIHTTFVPIWDLEAVAAAITDKTKVLYTEVVSNPTLVVSDLQALADIAHARGVTFVVDNTFTPVVVTPSRFGADVVVHSCTKFISGSSDIVAGAICGSKAFITSLMDFYLGPMMLLGPTLDPKIASELSLRLPHLPLRMMEHGRRALVLAQHLEHLGAAVRYPGLPSHPQHALLQQLVNPGYGYGGLLGLDMGTARRAEVLMERLQNKHSFGFMAVSLGYFDTLMSLSAASTSSELSDREKAAAGIADGYVRMSIGLTGTVEQRWQQLKEAYEFVVKHGDTPPFRAVKVRGDAGGPLEVLETWPSDLHSQQSGGSSEAEDQTEEDEGDSSALPHAPHTLEAAAAPAAGGVSGVKRVGGGVKRGASASDVLLAPDSPEAETLSLALLGGQIPTKVRLLDDGLRVMYVPAASHPAQRIATASTAPDSPA